MDLRGKEGAVTAGEVVSADDAVSAVTVGDFVKSLFDIRRPGEELGREGGLTLKEILRYGHFRLWLEDCDERNPQKALNRQGAARIIHQFLKIECGIKDIEDIKEAEKLKDLYTCRVCANHIAQVYLRGIIEAQEIENGIIIFNQLEPVLKEESASIISKTEALLSALE